ncbi:HD domain-containing protein [Hyphomicrobium sp. CS1GBMeth3]|uniref:HD domain-containing protein n=1 Tax=Hyphomicrobium sp. CS1GBMeth3 TaxID=1892845 RepID=UPI0009313BB4|nr:HD domain-containing protein [Hyphomicrobium sp. CS1GBMeth3]
MEEIVRKARAFAVEAHGAQRRKYEDVPYVVHLDRVVALLEEHGFNAPPLLAAAYLHDVVEDTSATMHDVFDAFGPDVAELVYWLTDAEQGNRRIRKIMSAWRLSRAPIEAKLIKLADFADNTPSIVERDPAFAKVYLAEKRYILDEMARVEGTRFSDSLLFKVAESGIRASRPKTLAQTTEE